MKNLIKKIIKDNEKDLKGCHLGTLTVEKASGPYIALSLNNMNPLEGEIDLLIHIEYHPETGHYTYDIFREKTQEEEKTR